MSSLASAKSTVPIIKSSVCSLLLNFDWCRFQLDRQYASCFTVCFRADANRIGMIFISIQNYFYKSACGLVFFAVTSCVVF